jgi:predicted DNA-binding transcriptional regulator YafY
LTLTNNKKKISFKYFNYNVQKKRVYRKGGSLYQVTPLTLCWNDDKYYLVAYNAEHNELRNYRVDRMSEVLELGDNADSFDMGKFNIAKHIKSVFGMFSGEVVCATLSFDNAFVNVVLDYFGKETKLIPKGNERFEIKVDVSVSPVFLGWMFQFGEGAEIIAPDSLVAAMCELISVGIKKYVKPSI